MGGLGRRIGKIIVFSKKSKRKKKERKFPNKGQKKKE